MSEESALLYGYEQAAQDHNEREANTLKLEPRFKYMAEMEESELRYWMSVFGEVKIKDEPESDKPF